VLCEMETLKKRKERGQNQCEGTQEHKESKKAEENLSEKLRQNGTRAMRPPTRAGMQLDGVTGTTAESKAENRRLFLEKTDDGRKMQRTMGSLKTLTNHTSGATRGGAKSDGERNRVNERRRKCQGGGDPCYDLLEDLGSAMCVYSLPLSIMAGLVTGFKSETAVAEFRKKSKTLSNLPATNYMFFHWKGKTESKKGDCKKHPFVKNKPNLVASTESLGNHISRNVLMNKELEENKQPGLLCNMKEFKGMSIQAPHWDFVGWRKTRAEDMPWVVHVPLCEEGMMLHVWPTERHEPSHMLPKEKFGVGTPQLVHIAFGDALVLRADVCHGGCFGSVGNMRFHMVLRKENCELVTKELHFLEHAGVEASTFKEKMNGLHQLLLGHDNYFKEEERRKTKTVVWHIEAMKKLHPAHDTWCDGLLGPVDCSEIKGEP
jgi:hypothetical protein